MPLRYTPLNEFMQLSGTVPTKKTTTKAKEPPVEVRTDFVTNPDGELVLYQAFAITLCGCRINILAKIPYPPPVNGNSLISSLFFCETLVKCRCTLKVGAKRQNFGTFCSQNGLA